MASNRQAPIPRPELFPNLLSRIEQFLFPALCIICDAPRHRDDRWFCTSCANSLEKNMESRQACPLCGQNTKMRTCSCEVAWDAPVKRIISFADYDDAVQAIMQQIKYHGKKHLAFHAGSLCSARVKQLLDDSVDMVIPVPLYWLRRQKRGYNQTEWFVRGLLGEAYLPKLALQVLKRMRPTATQTKLDKSARQKNVAGAFSVVPAARPYLCGKRVLVVDDVITTGATTFAAARALLDNGCREVTALSFARD